MHQMITAQVYRYATSETGYLGEWTFPALPASGEHLQAPEINGSCWYRVVERVFYANSPTVLLYVVPTVCPTGNPHG